MTNEYIITNEETKQVVGTATDIPHLHYVLYSLAMPDSILQDELRITYGGMCIASHETADNLCEQFRAETYAEEGLRIMAEEGLKRKQEEDKARYEAELDARLSDFYEQDGECIIIIDH